MITTTGSSQIYSNGIDTITVPNDYSYTTCISRYIDGKDVYINNINIKEYIDKKLAEVVQGNPDLDRRKYKVVMGEL